MRTARLVLTNGHSKKRAADRSTSEPSFLLVSLTGGGGRSVAISHVSLKDTQKAPLLLCRHTPPTRRPGRATRALDLKRARGEENGRGGYWWWCLSHSEAKDPSRRGSMRYQRSRAHTHTASHSERGKNKRRLGVKGGPTWLEHTLEIKDDQNKGSQTGGKNHPANPAHPHEFAQSLFHDGTEIFCVCCSSQCLALSERERETARARGRPGGAG